MTDPIQIFDQHGGVVRTIIPLDKDNFVIKTTFDMENVLENNKMLRENQNSRSDFRMLARGVPLTVYEKSIKEDWDESDWAKWLNDSDNKAFRIYEGRV